MVGARFEFSRQVGSCSLVCPNKGKFANIAAAKLQIEDADRAMIERSLQPNGKVKCAMTCRLHDFDEENGSRSFGMLPARR